MVRAAPEGRPGMTVKDPEREGGQWKEAIDQGTAERALMTRGRWFTADSYTLVVAILISLCQD